MATSPQTQMGILNVTVACSVMVVIEERSALRSPANGTQATIRPTAVGLRAGLAMHLEGGGRQYPAETKPAQRRERQ